MSAQCTGIPPLSFALVVGLAVALVVTIADRATAAPFRQAPGTVVIRDSMSRSNVVTFLVPSGASIGRREVAAAAAGIPNDGIQERSSDQRGVRQLRLRTSLSTRTSLLSRRINGRVVRGLDIFHQGRVVLTLHPWAKVVDGQVRPLGSDLLAHRYAVDGSADLAYRIPAPAILRALLLLLVLALVPFACLRVYASRVSHQGIDATDKAHRLRASLLVLGLVLPLGLLAVLFLGGFLLLPDVLLGGLAPGLSRVPVVQATASMLFLLAVFLVTLLPAVGSVAPYYRKLRGIEATRASRIGNLRLSLAFLLPMLLWVLLLNLPPATGLTPVVRLALQALGWVVIIAAAPLLAVRLMPTRPLEEPLRRRLDALLARGGVRVREIRVLDTRSQKVANALVMGPLPGLRYVLVTDYLLERLEQDELEAIVAHEMGHAKQHHLLIKLGAVLSLAVILGVALAFGSHLLQGVSPGVVLLAIPVLLLLALVLIQGGLGLVLERKADDYAARQVGVDPTIRALEKMAEANLLTHHPGVAQRVERLQAEQRRMPLSHTAPKGSGP
jgi:Zn-dependent protease with chaperone function